MVRAQRACAEHAIEPMRQQAPTATASTAYAARQQRRQHGLVIHARTWSQARGRSKRAERIDEWRWARTAAFNSPLFIATMQQKTESITAVVHRAAGAAGRQCEPLLQ